MGEVLLFLVDNKIKEGDGNDISDKKRERVIVCVCYGCNRLFMSESEFQAKLLSDLPF